MYYRYKGRQKHIGVGLHVACSTTQVMRRPQSVEQATEFHAFFVCDKVLGQSQ